MIHLRTLFCLMSLFGLFACQEDTLDLISFAQVSGHIVNEAGSTLAGVQVATVPPTSIALTDSSGAFLLSGIPAGDYTISTEKTGYRNESLKLALQPEQSATLAIVLGRSTKKQGHLSGTLRDAITQAPVAGVSITTHPATTALLTDADGRFHLDSLAVGDYQVRIKKLGYQTDSVVVAVTEQKTTRIELLLTPQAAVSFLTPVSPSASRTKHLMEHKRIHSKIYDEVQNSPDPLV